MSSKPAMMRSSRGVRPVFLSDVAKSESSASSSSRSNSLAITALFLETHKGCSAFRHAPLPGVLSSQGRHPAMILLEFYSPHGEIFGLFGRQPSALGADHRSDLLETFLAHGLCEDGVGLAERV